MRRRDFFKAIAGSAAAWPLAVRAQQSAIPVIGFLHAASHVGSEHQVDGYLQGLRDAGYEDKQNLAIAYRWAEGDYDRLPALAADLLQRKVAVLIAGGGNAPAEAAKAVTMDIPIIFVTGSDPVRAGLVRSLSHPGGNVTGVSMLQSVLMTKELDLMRQFIPHLELVAALINPHYSDADMQLRELQDAAGAMIQKIYPAKASTDAELDAQFAAMTHEAASALFVANDLFFTTRRAKIIAYAASRSLPLFCTTRDFVTDGALMSYAPSLRDAYVQAADYTVKILKGAKPSELPVLQPTKFDLVINAQAAKTLGLQIPPTLLAIADEVIE